MKWQYNSGPDRVRARRWRVGLYSALLFASLSVGLYSFSVFSHSSVAVQPEETVINVAPPRPVLQQALTWPAYGQAAYGTAAYGVMAQSSPQETPVPIASLTKTITALAVLQKKPLHPGETGPAMTITQADVALYDHYLAKNGSVAKVAVGQQLSQQHAMQAMMMQSANNITDTVAIWAFGSIEAYVEYTNTMLREMGLTKTTVADASGFSPQSVSTAEEMTQIAIAYMQTPVLKEITLLPETTIPVMGGIKNRNARVNTPDIVGIKTGNTNEAGRCFMAANLQNGQAFSVAVVLGAEDLTVAMLDAQAILRDGNTKLSAVLAQ